VTVITLFDVCFNPSADALGHRPLSKSQVKPKVSNKSGKIPPNFQRTGGIRMIWVSAFTVPFQFFQMNLYLIILKIG
jgi:hypothetical protein